MINWREIENVFFDMDGTLLDLHYDNYFWLDHLPKRYAAIKGVPYESAVTKLHSMYEKHFGSLNWYCLDFWAKHIDVDLMSLKREVNEKIAYRPNVETFLDALNQKPLKLAIVTNAHQGSIQVKLEQTDLAERFEEIFSSHDFGHAKEAPEFWAALQNSRHFDPNSTVFFDDNEDVLKSAEAFGFKHLYFIGKPDSQKPSRTHSEFPIVNDFLDLL